MKPRNVAMFVVMFLAATSVSVSQIKIVPLLEMICQSANITYAQTSWLMSVFTIAGIILAVPAGGLIAKFGPKRIFCTVMALSVVGNALGALSVSNFAMLLLSRVVEGSAFAMVSIAGVVFINAWFPAKQGLFNGIYTTFGAIGSFLALSVILPLYNGVGLAGVWWVMTAIIAVLTVACLVFLEEVRSDAPAGAPGAPALNTATQLGQVVRSKAILAIAGCQLLCGLILYFFINNYPTIFTQLYGFEPANANLYGSIFSLFGIPFCIFGGFICDRMGPRRSVTMMAVSFAVLAVVVLATTFLLPGTYIVHMALISFITGVAMTAQVYIIPFCVKDFSQIGMGVSLLTMGFNIGIFIGNPIIMYAVEGTGNWNWASYILCAASVLAVLLMLVFIKAAKSEGNRVYAAPAPETEMSHQKEMAQ